MEGGLKKNTLENLIRELTRVKKFYFTRFLEETLLQGRITKKNGTNYSRCLSTFGYGFPSISDCKVFPYSTLVKQTFHHPRHIINLNLG